MTGFRKREQQRQVGLKGRLFNPVACQSGSYKGGKQLYQFCLHQEEENLHDSIRSLALDYYRHRSIPWHSLGHLLSSQVFCANAWFPFFYEPTSLAVVLQGMGYDVSEILPFSLDTLSGEEPHYIAFEWIGERNYLQELSWGCVAKDDTRSRGQAFTSADFAFRFRRSDDTIQIVLGEWKYVENYQAIDKRISRSGTDRLQRIYATCLNKSSCQICLGSIPTESLFYDPFDQMMRLQLLASAMEEHREMGADVVSTIHICPRANQELLCSITSSELVNLGSTIHSVWNRIVTSDRFQGYHTEDLLPVLLRNATNQSWASYMQFRYGGMK